MKGSERQTARFNTDIDGKDQPYQTAHLVVSFHGSRQIEESTEKPLSGPLSSLSSEISGFFQKSHHSSNAHPPRIRGMGGGPASARWRDRAGGRGDFYSTFTPNSFTILENRISRSLYLFLEFSGVRKSGHCSTFQRLALISFEYFSMAFFWAS